MLAALFLSTSGLFPTAPTLTVFRVRDFGGKSYDDVRIRSMEGKLRIEAFGRVFVFSGKKWYSPKPLELEDSGAVAFLAPFESGSRVAAVDGSGRATVLLDVPAGPRRARVEYRYDGAGLAAVNLVFSDGSGYQFRRTSAEPGVFPPSDFEPPREIGPPPKAGGPGVPAGATDRAAVDRLFAVVIGDPEQADFERAGGVGRFVPRIPR